MDAKYTPIYQNSLDADSVDALKRGPETPRQSRLQVLSTFLGLSLLGSLVVNYVFIHREFVEPWLTYDKLPSKYGECVLNLGNVRCEP